MSTQAAGGTLAIVLAAGDGKRLSSARPKVVHRVAGRPLVAHVAAALRPLSLDGVVVVVSPSGRAEVAAALESAGLAGGVSYAVQDPPKGTADAVGTALPGTDEAPGRILVVPGDTPLLRSTSLQALLDEHAAAGPAAAVLTAVVADPGGYGRVVRGEGGAVTAIVEEADATSEQLSIREINAGVYVFDRAELARMLDKVDCDNAQGEYYLTDVVGLLSSDGLGVVAVEAPRHEVMGVNSRAQLADVAQAFRALTCERWLGEGVTIVDPATTYIDPTAAIASDAVLYPFTFIEGATTIGPGAEIGPQARVVDSDIGEGASVTFAVVRGSTIGPGASVGPFASVRPGTVLARGGRIGTFVETKSSSIGEDSRVPHLSYIGDAEIGRGVNVGAGTITCNWDGVAKHRTVIDDDAYIGSDTMLVAPVHVGRRAATGAGSVVRGDVPDDALAVGVPARVMPGKGNKMSAPKSGEPGADKVGEDDDPDRSGRLDDRAGEGKG